MKGFEEPYEKSWSEDEEDICETEDSDWEEFCIQVCLLVEYSELWYTTGNESYRQKMLYAGTGLWLYMEEELQEVCGQPVDISLVYIFILDYLVGKENCETIVEMLSFLQNGGNEEFFDLEYAIFKIVQMAKILYETEMEVQGERMLKELRGFALESGTSEVDDMVRGIIMNEEASFYLEYDPQMSWILYQKYSSQMRTADEAGCVVFCSELSELMLSESYEKAILLINDAWSHVSEIKDELTEKQLCQLYYRYAAFHVICCEEYGYLEDLEEIFKRLDEESPETETEITAADPELDFIRMNIAYLLLVKSVYDRISARYLHHAQVFYDLSKKYDEVLRESPALNHKIAAHYLSCVYEEMGENLVAESYLKEAARMADDYPNSDVDYYVLSNLLLIYLKQNNLQEGMPLAEKLAYKIENGQYPENITRDQVMANIFMIANCFVLEGSREKAVGIIRDNLKLIRTGETHDIHIVSAVYRAMISWTIRREQALTDAEGREFRQYLDAVEKSPHFTELRTPELLEHWGVKMILYWNLRDVSPYEEILEQYQSLLMKGVSLSQEREVSFCSGVLAAVGMRLEEYELAESLAGMSLSLHMHSLGKALVYQNRKRLEAAIGGSYNSVYMTCYSIFHERAKTEELYSIVLNWKDPVSLITVFRNETLEKQESVRKLSEEINHLMDLQADKEVNLLYGKGNAGGEEISQRIEELEYEFARMVNGDYKFQPFSIEELMERMPDNTAFLEYFTYYEELYNVYLDAEYLDEDFLLFEKRQIDIFCFVKVKGVCRVKRFQVPDMIAMQKEILFCWREMGKRTHKKLDESRRRLYEALIKPVEKELDGVKQLLIAPDSILNNFPFEFLLDGSGDMLGEKYEIAMVNSGRDILRKAGDEFGSHFVVVGNPAYDFEREREIDEDVRKTSLRKAIKELPFSELEAYMVADELNAVPCVGLEADKKVVDRIRGARWAHLATHGISDISVSQDAWYSSALLFAGAENWRKTGILYGRFGNGMVTADEISRMKLKNTEMVVLSACFAGRVSYSNLAGIRSAFRDAGVKYVVSALWEVDDMAAAIFMKQFYQYLKEYSVPAALWKTKEYLRSLTIDQTEEFFREQIKKYQDFRIKGIDRGLEYLRYQRQKYTGEYKLYEDPYYWSAFICVQNAF